MANNQERKTYSFINMKRCLNKDGGSFIGVTAKGFVSKHSGLRMTTSGKGVCDFQMPISNRGKYIESMCGLAPVEQDDVCWCRVTMWEKVAERFCKYMEKHPRCIVTVTGLIRVVDREGKDGNTYRKVEIVADDFDPFRDVSSNGGAARSEQPGSASGRSSQFEDLSDEDDGELPF